MQGILAGYVAIPPLGDNFLAFDVAFFIAQGHRSAENCNGLLSDFEAWAYSQGASGIVMGSSVDTNTLSRFWKRKKYLPIVSSYYKALDN